MDMADRYYQHSRDVIIGGLLTNVSTENIPMTREALNGFNRAKLVTKEHFEDEEKRNFILAKLVTCFSISDEVVLESVMMILNDIAIYIYPHIGDYL